MHAIVQRAPWAAALQLILHWLRWVRVLQWTGAMVWHGAHVHVVQYQASICTLMLNDAVEK